MHLLRLLMSARDLLRTGELRIDVGEQREPLLAVKRGEVPWARVEAWMVRLAAEAEQALRGQPAAAGAGPRARGQGSCTGCAGPQPARRSRTTRSCRASWAPAASGRTEAACASSSTA